MNDREFLESLKEKYPDSLPYWKEYLEDDEPLTIMALSHFADYVIELIQKGNFDNVKAIFDYMEFLLQKGAENEQTAIATGFLEYLDNASFKDVKVKEALNLLGDECRAYLKAWEDFWKGRK